MFKNWTVCLLARCLQIVYRCLISQRYSSCLGFRETANTVILRRVIVLHPVISSKKRKLMDCSVQFVSVSAVNCFEGKSCPPTAPPAIERLRVWSCSSPCCWWGRASGKSPGARTLHSALLCCLFSLIYLLQRQQWEIRGKRTLCVLPQPPALHSFRKLFTLLITSSESPAPQLFCGETNVVSFLYKCIRVSLCFEVLIVGATAKVILFYLYCLLFSSFLLYCVNIATYQQPSPHKAPSEV